MERCSCVVVECIYMRESHRIFSYFYIFLEMQWRIGETPPDNLLLIIICASTGGLILLLIIIILVVHRHHRRRTNKLKRQLSEKS